MSNIKERVKRTFQKSQAVKQAKMRQEFLPEALEIIEKPASPIGHFVILVTAGIVLFFGVWSFLGKMDVVVTARGKVITVSGVQTIQAPNTGIVEQICVQEGDYVSAGQDIIVVDSTANNIVLQNTEENLALRELENELLVEILEGNDISYMLSEETDIEKCQMIEYVLAIQKEYESQKSDLNSNVEQTLLQITLEKENYEQIQENIEFLTKQKESLSELIVYSNAEEKNSEKIALLIQYKQKKLADYQQLYELGAVSKDEVDQITVELEQLKKDCEMQQRLSIYEDYENGLRIKEVDNQLNTMQSNLSSQKTVVEMAEQKYEQAVQSVEILEAEYRTKLSSYIVENENMIKEQEVNHEIQTITAEQQKVVSPVDGIVKTMEINTEGGVLTAAQAVATIVPDGEQLIVEISIRNQDIGCIEIGQEVVIKLDAYNFQEYGKLEGTVVSISPDAILDKEKGWVYIAKVEICDAKFKENNSDVEIGVGMECITEVKVGERRIVDFFLEPLVKHLDGSLKVR